MDGQREHLEQLGIVPLPREPETPVKPSKAASGNFERGVVFVTTSIGPAPQ